MTNCIATQIEFPVFKRCKVEAQFSGGDHYSNGDVLLLRAVDQQGKQTNCLTDTISEILAKSSITLVTRTATDLWLSM